MYEYWTEDDFASSFRKMLTIEQFRSEEMQKLYQQYLVAGPASYVKDLFDSMGFTNAKNKAVRFYSVLYFYYSIYDCFHSYLTSHNINDAVQNCNITICTAS